jgi:hypothetical protein
MNEKKKEKKGAAIYPPTKELIREMFNTTPLNKSPRAKPKNAPKSKSRK